jgi:shikimate dehydrogenase
MIRAAVLGSPISHSLSPLLHRAAYSAMALNGEYEAIEVNAAGLATFIATRDQTWSGFSLTMPLKEAVLQVATSVDPLARQIQSANTLIRSESGWHALSTDVSGFQHALSAHGITTYQKIVIIGCGATARAAAAACDELDVDIVVVHRSRMREEAMSNAVRNCRVSFLNWNVELPEADLIINTTPAHVADFFVTQFTSRPRGIFFEALYHPWPTKLLAHWQSLGGQSLDGLDLLVHQAIDQISLICKVKVNRDELAPLMRAAGLAALKE